MNNKILLLEDDVSLIDGLKYALEKNGFEVEFVRTVQEALSHLAEIAQYNMLILDVTLPDGTGFEVCEKVRKQGSRIPIIYLTASDEEVNIIRGLDCGGRIVRTGKDGLCRMRGHPDRPSEKACFAERKAIGAHSHGIPFSVPPGEKCQSYSHKRDHFG